MINKDGLDEMQRQRHGRIGSQMFIAMCFALLANIGLYGAGVRWLEYPTDVMAIVNTCLWIYLVRLIIAGAYEQPKIPQKKTAIITVTIAVALAVVSAMALSKLPAAGIEETEDYSAYALVGTSAVGLIAVGIAAAVKRKRDAGEQDD